MRKPPAMATASSRRSVRNAPRATRLKPAVSYAEQSSSDDDDDESGGRDDSEIEHEYSAPASNPRRSTRNSQVQSSKRRRHSQQANEIKSFEVEVDKPACKKRKQSRSTSSRTTRTTRSSRSLRLSRGIGAPRISRPRKPVEVAPPTPVISSGVIPPWQTLPFSILVHIFQYAAYPLYDEHTFIPTSSQKWLLEMSRSCRAFTEPALTALYQSPPLVPMLQAHELIDLLNADPDLQSLNYRRKIRSLCIDVGQVATYSQPGHGVLDMHSLIKNLPLLANLELHHQKDMPPYRDLESNLKWTYPESMFDALEYVNPAADDFKEQKTSVCRLKSWRWSSRLAGKKWPIENLKEVHLRPSFVGLQKISFMNYQVPVTKQDEEDPAHENVLADSLTALKSLHHLVFECSTLVNGKLLPLLPKNLRKLELINCWEVNAEEIAGFLLTHGRHLRELILNHNQSLSMSFLPILGTACPDLEVFKMNCTYFNIHATYHDSEPVYDKLLLPDQVPVWPSTLHVIELIQLRKWETEAAEMFFQSLLDDAAFLPDLRYLTIQAILNIGWRDRASFRDKWVGSINRVFKRALVAPKVHTTVKPQFVNPQPEPGARRHSRLEVSIPVRETKTESKRHSIGSGSSSAGTSLSSTQKSPNGRPKRSCVPKGNAYVESPDTSDAEEDPDLSFIFQERSPRRLVGLARELSILKQTAGIDNPTEMPSSPVASNSNSSDSDGVPLTFQTKNKQPQIIQGMCEVVELRIDNLRPTEIQVTEADFLDEEVSGDDDWNGEDPDEDGYGW